MLEREGGLEKPLAPVGFHRGKVPLPHPHPQFMQNGGRTLKLTAAPRSLLRMRRERTR